MILSFWYSRSGFAREYDLVAIKVVVPGKTNSMGLGESQHVASNIENGWDIVRMLPSGLRVIYRHHARTGTRRVFQW
jgi:hypothetical protein